jgi:hypothetical protein
MSVFSDDWRDCLREQYKSVVRNDDQVTLPSLTNVMYQVGFTEDELTQLRIQATMRTEDMADGFVPDMPVFQPSVQGNSVEAVAHPLECQCPECVGVNLAPHDEEGQPLEGDDLLEFAERQEFEADDEDSPTQMSLF